MLVIVNFVSVFSHLNALSRMYFLQEFFNSFKCHNKTCDGWCQYYKAIFMSNLNWPKHALALVQLRVNILTLKSGMILSLNPFQ